MGDLARRRAQFPSNMLPGFLCVWEAPLENSVESMVVPGRPPVSGFCPSWKHWDGWSVKMGLPAWKPDQTLLLSFNKTCKSGQIFKTIPWPLLPKFLTSGCCQLHGAWSMWKVLLLQEKNRCHYSEAKRPAFIKIKNEPVMSFNPFLETGCRGTA